MANSNRVSMAMIRKEVRRLNVEAGNPQDPEWNYAGGYVLTGAYGGWQLQRTCSDGHGVICITPGYLPKRALYNILSCMTGVKSECNL